MESGSVERGLRRKVLWRLIAPLTFLIFLSSLDRSNVALAALQMNREIGLTPEMYGRGAGLFFFLGYIALQYPHTAILRRIHARRWVTGTVVLWGAVAAATALIQSPLQFYAMRFVLGVAEGGFAPGATYLAAIWMPRQFRAAAVTATMLAVPISQVVGAPLSGWIMTLPVEVAGLHGWRLMVAGEGLATVLFGLLAWRVFVDRLDDAPWLTPEEKALAEQELARDAAERAGAGSLRFLASLRFWTAAAVWFCLLAGALGLMFWMAQVVKQVAGGNPLEVGVVSALPWAGVGAGMLLGAWSSDRTGERHGHLAVGGLLSAACLLTVFLVPPGWASVVLLLAGGVGLGAAQAAFWPIPIGLLGREDTGRGVTVVNMIGNAAGMIITPVIGLIRQRTGDFGAPIYLLCATLALAALLALALKGASRAPQPVSRGA